MDVINLASAHLNSNQALQGFLETVAGFAFIVFVLFLEMHRRTNCDESQGARSGGTFGSLKSLLRHCAPELLGMALVAALVVVIRSRGDRGNVGQEFDEVWSSIKNDWPVLMTADTLLSLQAMLRLIIAVSVVLRTDDPASGPVPLMEEPAVFLVLATCSRVALLTRTSHYMLDGPFGGTLPAACEIAVVPLLAVLGSGAAKKTMLSSLTAVVGVAVWFASRNRLNLGEDFYADTLFILVHTLELAAGFAYLARTLHIVCDYGHTQASAAQAGLVHVLMVLQQAMPAYYFVVAFEYTPELISAGHPFEVLQYGNIACLGAFFAAFALHAAMAETDKSATHAPVQGAAPRLVAAAL